MLLWLRCWFLGHRWLEQGRAYVPPKDPGSLYWVSMADARAKLLAGFSTTTLACERCGMRRQIETWGDQGTAPKLGVVRSLPPKGRGGK